MSRKKYYNDLTDIKVGDNVLVFEFDDDFDEIGEEFLAKVIRTTKTQFLASISENQEDIRFSKKTGNSIDWNTWTDDIYKPLAKKATKKDIKRIKDTIYKEKVIGRMQSIRLREIPTEELIPIRDQLMHLETKYTLINNPEDIL